MGGTIDDKSPAFPLPFPCLQNAHFFVRYSCNVPEQHYHQPDRQYMALFHRYAPASGAEAGRESVATRHVEDAWWCILLSCSNILYLGSGSATKKCIHARVVRYSIDLRRTIPDTEISSPLICQDLPGEPRFFACSYL